MIAVSFVFLIILKVLPGNVSLDGFGLMVVNEDEVTEEAKEALRILADLFENNPSTKASETVLRKVDAANVAAMMIIRQKSLSEIFKSLPYLRVTTNDQVQRKSNLWYSLAE